MFFQVLLDLLFLNVDVVLQSAGMQAIDDIVPTLLKALEDDETSDMALDGLKQILRYIFTLMN